MKNKYRIVTDMYTGGSPFVIFKSGLIPFEILNKHRSSLLKRKRKLYGMEIR